MKTLLKTASAIICLYSVTAMVRAQVPQIINYQGRVLVGSTNFDGSGQFKFALVNAPGTTTYWSNNGSSVNGSEPSAAVTLTVTKGLYSVLLGDTSITNMTIPIPATVFANSDVRLRVWFNDGTHLSQLLTPDQRIVAAGSALMASDITDGAITTAKLGTGAVTSTKLANGAVGTAQLASGAVGAANIANGAVGTPQLAPGALATSFNITGTTQLAQPNTSYAATSASLTTIGVPGNANAGDVVQVAGVGAGGWTFDFSNGQQLLARPWTPRENNRSWTSVASSSGATKLFAAVGGGQLYTSTDSGMSWTPRESTRSWSSVASSSDGTKLLAAVDNGQLYTSTDSGVSWTPRESVRSWQAVASSADGTKLVAVVSSGIGGLIYTSTDSGVSWTPRESTRSWTSVASSSDGTKLLAAVDNGQLYTSTDSGASWTPRESTRHWRSVASSSDGTKLIAAVFGGQLYTSTDSGVSWTPRESSRTWTSVASSSDGTKLLAAVNNGQLYTSIDSGVSWTPPTGTAQWISVASSADGTKLLAAVSGGQLYTSNVTSGGQGSTAALQYLGNNLWTIVEESHVAAGAIDTPQLAANAVSSANIAAGAVTNTQLANNSVATADIQTGAITSVQLAPSSVGSAQLANSAVTSASIASGAVTNTQLASNAVATANIQNAAVTSVQLASSAVVTTNIANAAVTAAKLDPSIGVWTTTGSNVYRSAGYVGIGTNAPQRPLHVGNPSALSEAIVRFSTTATGGAGGRTWEIGVPESDSNFGDQYYSFGIFDTGIGGAPQFMIQYATGNVGIGTATPANRLDVQGNADFTGSLGVGSAGATHGTLEIGINSGSYTTGGATGFSSINHSFLVDYGAGTFGSAIYASGDVITTNSFAAISDERVKNIIGRSDATRDLNTLLGIEITDYRYKDVIAHGDAPSKKVIAQQVEKVFPQAVKKQTGEVPDIYKLATIKDGWIALATDLKQGERVKLITDEAQGVYEVLEVRDGAFRTDFKSATDKVFVYGREVKDFRNVDYDAIAMLNVSATQEMQREIECLKANLGWQNRQFTDLRQQDESQLAALRDENAILRKDLAALVALDKEREARLTRLEISMPATQPVANIR